MSRDIFGAGMSFVSRKASGYYEISVAPDTGGKWHASIVVDFNNGNQGIHQKYLWFDEDPRFLMLFLWGHLIESVGEHLWYLIGELEKRLDGDSPEEISCLITDYRDSAREIGEKLHGHMTALGIHPSINFPPLDTFNFSSALLRIGKHLAGYLNKMTKHAVAIQQSGRKFLVQMVRNRMQRPLHRYFYQKDICIYSTFR